MVRIERYVKNTLIFKHYESAKYNIKNFESVLLVRVHKVVLGTHPFMLFGNLYCE